MKKFIIFIIFILLLSTVCTQSMNDSYSASYPNHDQKIEFLISVTKIPHMVNEMGLDVDIHFPLGKINLENESDFLYANMELHSMYIYNKNYGSSLPQLMLTVAFKNRANSSFSNIIKKFFEKYLNVTFSDEKEFSNNDERLVCYYENVNKTMLMRSINDFYMKTGRYSYSKIFSLGYLENLYSKYGSHGDFGYIHYYFLDKGGNLDAEIEFSNSTVEEYRDGLHTYDLLKFLNLTSLPPGEITIEGNAMQTYTHTDFYFKSLKTNVPYTVENTTYFNVTRAFEVHINADKNITQLVVSFETRENYNLDDFLTDYGDYLLCSALIIVPVALIAVFLLKRNSVKENTEGNH